MDNPEQATTDPEIREIRERYEYATDEWKDIRDEGALDMKFLVGDPWEADAKQEREEAGRPMLTLDELNQYVNQAINTYRQNKRGIQISPAGNEATDKTAEYWEDRVRGIEVSSAAQQCVYIPAFQSMLERSYGFMRVTRKYAPGKTFNQEVFLKGITNPDTVTMDPDPKEADWSDIEYCFVADPMRRGEFKRKYPKAKIIDFSGENMAEAPDWIREDHVVIAEYWKRVHKPKTLLLVADKKGKQQIVFAEEIKGQNDRWEVLKEREYDEISLIQQMTNGLEILEEIPQPGTLIPIVAAIGLERYLTDNGKTKRVIMSAIRLARDPQMLYNYLASQEAEEASMSPKAPFVGAKGQFESDEEAWSNLHKQPRAYVQYDAITDQTTQTVLPAPVRPQFQPNFQAYEIAKEAARRAIQAAMGITPLPTAAQRRNEKSGIALERIDNMEAVGNFHFTDNMDRALQLVGRIILDWGPVVDDTEREVPLVKKDGSTKVVRINTAEPYQTDDGDTEHYPVVQTDAEGNLAKIGDHKVTINTGPSRSSEREEVGDYLNTLATIPELFLRVADIATRMRNLGPLGDEIADRLTPPEFAKPGSPQEAAGKLGQAQQQMQVMQQQMAEAVQKIQQLELEKKGRVIDNQFKAQLEQMRGQMEQANNEVKVLVAEIQTKAQKESERDALYADLFKHLTGQIHEKQMQAADQQHEGEMAQHNAEVAEQQQATQIQADQQGAEEGEA